MKKQLFLALVFGVVICASCLGQGTAKEGPPKKEASDRERALKFLREHFIDKTVATKETVFKYAGNKVEGVTSGTDTYANLVVTDDGFQFDVVTVSKLTNYDLDDGNKRVMPGRNEDGTYVTRYDMSERRSTGKLVGTSRVISSTNKNFPAGLTMAVVMTVPEAGLQTREHSVFYEDFFEAKGKWKAGASETTIQWSLEKGKLRVDGENLQFDVDPKTLKKTRTADPAMKWSSTQRP